MKEKEKKLIKAAACVATCAVVAGVLLNKRKKIGKKINKIVRSQCKSYCDTNYKEPASEFVSRESIAERAYHIFLSGVGGSSLDHWLMAEKQLLKF